MAAEMDVPVRDNTIYVFDGFLLEPARRSLSRDGAAIRLRPRLFDVLMYLVENPGRVVGKDELLAHVWAGRTVMDCNLNQTIFGLRKVLRAHGDLSGCILTATGRGYRFVAPVSFHADASEVSGCVVPEMAEPMLVDIARSGSPGPHGLARGMKLAWHSFWHALHHALPPVGDGLCPQPGALRPMHPHLMHRSAGYGSIQLS